ncbi:MAG TPA: tripartite tricarboxylate transporter permease [Thermodesulfobacteriota bacterium]|nr:tripartite tricarboxylate transporter permease [Thermodesulfobacteriota bacterium]
METVALLFQGFSNALSLENLLFALIGSILGTLVGVLPGIGPTAGIAMLIPITGILPATPAIIMLAAIYYGAMYGGSTTSILMNVPGEIASVVTCIDGHSMAKQGRAAAALAIAAIASFVAGTIGLVGLTFFSPLLADTALKMGPPETFGLVIFAFSMVASMAGESLLMGVTSAALGMMICLVGNTSMGVARFTFGSVKLTGGFNLIAVVMGLFAVNEVFKNIGEEIGSISDVNLGAWWKMIRWREVKQSLGAIVRSTFLGFFLGCIPGFSPAAVSFVCYDAEKKVSKNRANFGKGAIEGVAAPEGGNNSATSGGFVPLLTLGIPPSVSLAVLLGGLMIYGLQPGPMLFEKQPAFVWTVIASMYIGNVMLLILNLPFVGLWAKMVRVPYHFIAPLILLFCFLGTYSVRNNFFDVGTCLAFGCIAVILEKLSIPVLPLVIGLILTPMMEDSLCQTISMGGGSLGILWSRPIALALIGAGTLTMIIIVYIRRRWSKAGLYLNPGEEKYRDNSPKEGKIQ